MKASLLTTVVLFTLAAGASRPAAQSPMATLARRPDVVKALDLVRATEAQTIADQIRFCETPAPPFQESARAALLRRAFEQLGLQNVRVDRAGNVLGDRPGSGAGPRLLVAAHLDTVFPPETKVAVRRSNATLTGPGIGDNCRGLAALVAIVRAMRTAGIQTAGTVTFTANVGEEGLGDLRGMKELFGVANGSRAPARPNFDRFVSIDGPGVFVINVGVGSHRYRVTFSGPGGHSYGAFGTANPIGALGRAIAKINELQVPAVPRTTFNVGRVGGGTSVNAIPFEAWMEVDLRSSDRSALAALDARFQRAVDEAVAEENARWKSTSITATKELVGDRPAGQTAASSAIVRLAIEAGATLGFALEPGEASTDANLPVSLGIPAITIGGGGSGSDAHALSESFDSAEAWKGVQHALLVIVGLAQP
ncbi:MAG TPA: M20/M25/M40 family metallo-hydrolase [Vicinamibacterales bacterium]|nr:M20/M25/M40 family metallo-hydrolase [Vicinamibacterales bacterium]